STDGNVTEAPPSAVGASGRRPEESEGRSGKNGNIAPSPALAGQEPAVDSGKNGNATDSPPSTVEASAGHAEGRGEGRGGRVGERGEERAGGRAILDVPSPAALPQDPNPPLAVKPVLSGFALRERARAFSDSAWYRLRTLTLEQWTWIVVLTLAAVLRF